MRKIEGYSIDSDFPVPDSSRSTTDQIDVVQADEGLLLVKQGLETLSLTNHQASELASALLVLIDKPAPQ